MPDEAIIDQQPVAGGPERSTGKSMTGKTRIFVILSFIVGISVGYLVSLGSSLKKLAESAAAIPSAVAAMDGFSDCDMAFVLRLVKGGYAGKDTYKDPVVLKHISQYYTQRISLPAAQQEALGACVLLSSIQKMKETNPVLQKLIEAEQITSADKHKSEISKPQPPRCPAAE